MKNIVPKSSVKDTEIEGEEHQFVTFLIEDETYGVGVEQVKEIIGMTEITYVPNTASFMEGVINLRGTVVPVVDMRKKFRMKIRQFDKYTVIIIIEVRERLIGMIVDSVSDVVNIPVSSIQETPNFISRIRTDFIEGIGQVDDTLVIILNADLILSEEEIESLNSVDNEQNTEDNPQNSD